MPRVLPAAALVMMLAAASVSAEAPPPVAGTETNPELSDPRGNVEYSPLYTGPKDRDHIDLLAGWFEYLPDNDTLMFTLKVASLDDAWEKTRDGWWVAYSFRGNLSDGQRDTGVLQFWIDDQADDWRPLVWIDTSAGRVEVPAATTVEATAPGYFRYFLPMGFIQNWGVQVAEFNAWASEEQFIADTLTTGILNRNAATSDTTFVLEGLEPTPIDAEDDDFLTPRPRTNEPTATGASVALGFAAAAMTLATLAIAVRRRTHP